MSNYYVMLHDEMRCIGCQSCTVACANLNDVSHPFSRVQVQIKLDEESSKSPRLVFERFSCRQCDNAPCVKVCPTGATYQDENKTVVVNADLCINCSYCLGACPYNVRFIDKAKKSADKCDFCTNTRLKDGILPACVSVCPTDALIFGHLDSPEVQEWMSTQKNIYQDEKPETGKLHLYRNKEVHNG